ncbi:UNVERIFIED_CONTAM: hypothetical protein Slati_3479200 [Sesamum latifolium]|uniref:Retrotransposon Copia-like N-terminal domain-containing protein n=1 Tax=Sesamum latifolium TaxID=2727402 RepID=A0AAW2UH31_9LAMI
MTIEVAEGRAVGEGTNGARMTPVGPQYGSEVLQLLSSDHPGLVLVSLLLDGNNFLTWSRAVRRTVGAKLKLGFVTDTGKKLTNPELIE